MARPSGAAAARAPWARLSRSGRSSACGSGAAPAPNSDWARHDPFTESPSPCPFPQWGEGWLGLAEQLRLLDRAQAALAGLAMQPLRRRQRAMQHVVIEVDRPAQHEHDIADDIGVLFRARAGREKPDREQHDPDDQIKRDQCAHDTAPCLASDHALHPDAGERPRRLLIPSSSGLARGSTSVYSWMAGSSPATTI